MANGTHLWKVGHRKILGHYLARRIITTTTTVVVSTERKAVGSRELFQFRNAMGLFNFSQLEVGVAANWPSQAPHSPVHRGVPVILELIHPVQFYETSRPNVRVPRVLHGACRQPQLEY